jgi:hypothetical protein
MDDRKNQGVEMSTTQVRIVSAGLLFLFIFLFGYWLNRTGKPYHVIIFTIHKLLTLGTIVYLAKIIYNVQQVTPLSPSQILVLVITAVCFIATMATGALLSIDKPMPLIVHRFHQIIPFLTLLSTSATLYLLLVKSGEIISS